MSMQIRAAFPTVQTDGIEGVGGDSWIKGRGSSRVPSFDLAPPKFSTADTDTMFTQYEQRAGFWMPTKPV